MATPIRVRITAATGVAVAVAIATAGCGTSAHARLQAASPTKASKPSKAPGPPPAGWGKLRTASGAALPYPPGWRRIAGDRGSASAALFDPNGTIRAYLNATPAGGDETVADWTRFRLEHNAEDGDHGVRLISTRDQLALGEQRSACVTDQYITTRTSYREIACIVAQRRKARATVLVAAAQPDVWAQERPAFELAFRNFIS